MNCFRRKGCANPLRMIVTSYYYWTYDRTVVINDGQFRCPSSQQGFSPFTTWTRGLAWLLLGFAEQLEFLLTLDNAHWSDLTRYFKGYSGSELKNMVMDTYLKAALATAQWYRLNSFSDGMVYWDSGAPHLPHPVTYRNTPSDPFNLTSCSFLKKP